MGAHGLKGLLLCRGSILLSRSWLITVVRPLDISGTHLPLSLMLLLQWPIIFEHVIDKISKAYIIEEDEFNNKFF